MNDIKWTVGQEVGISPRGGSIFRGKVTKVTAHRVYARLARPDGGEFERTFTEWGRPYPWVSGGSNLRPWDKETDDLWQIALRDHAKRQRRAADARREHAKTVEKARAVIDLLESLLDDHSRRIGKAIESETIRDARAFLERMKPGDDA